MLLVVVIILLVSVLYLLKRNAELQSQSVSISPESIVSIVDLSPETSATQLATLTTSPVASAVISPELSKIDLIKEALATKLSVSITQITATISKESDNSAFGSVSTSEEGGGGWFVAAKKDGDWVIVEDGNGTIDCAPLEGYDIPVSVVSECWDSANLQLKNR